MWREEIRKRFNWALGAIFECLVTTGVTGFFFIALLFGCRMMWSIYNETPVGKIWVSTHLHEADLIVWILSSDLIHLTIFLLSTFILTSLPLLFFARILFVYRFLYDSQSRLYRLILCGGPLIYFAAKPISAQLELELIEAATLLALPALAITPSMLNMVKMVVPEPSEFFQLFRQWKHDKVEPPMNREDYE